MSAMLHSQADVMRRLLISLSAGSNPDDATPGAWPVYATKEPNVPDSVITIYDTAGQESGRVMQGDRIDYPGFQVRVRAATGPAAFVKAESITSLLDAVLRTNVVMPDGSVYYVAWVVRGHPMLLGQNKPTSRHFVYTFDGYLSVKLVP